MTDAERDRLIQEIHKAIYGNTDGRRGLMVRMALVEDRMAMMLKAALIALGTLLTANVGILVAILTHTLKIP